MLTWRKENARRRKNFSFLLHAEILQEEKKKNATLLAAEHPAATMFSFFSFLFLFLIILGPFERG